MGLSNHFITGLIALLITGTTHIREIRETTRRVTRPVVSCY